MSISRARASSSCRRDCSRSRIARSGRRYRLALLRIDHDAVRLWPLPARRPRAWWASPSFGFSSNRAGDVVEFVGLKVPAGRKVEGFLGPGQRLVRPRLIVEDVAAIDHETCDLQHGKTCRSQSGTTGMTRMSRSDFMRRGRQTFGARKMPALPRRPPWPPRPWAPAVDINFGLRHRRVGEAARPARCFDSRRNTLSRFRQ